MMSQNCISNTLQNIKHLLFIARTDKIMETYIFITTEQKKQLVKLANAKQLSLSTTCAIIIKWLYPIITQWYDPKSYIKKGEKQIHIKIRNTEKFDITSITATNCIYCYLTKPLVKGEKINWQHKYIQAELDRTEDKNCNKNIEMRIAYRVQKGQLTQ